MYSSFQQMFQQSSCIHYILICDLWISIHCLIPLVSLTLIESSLLPGTTDITLNVRENEDIGTFIGDIYHYGKSKDNNSQKPPTFYIISQTPQQYDAVNDPLGRDKQGMEKKLVKLDETTGRIYVASPIDREAICPKLSNANQPCYFTIVITINKQRFMTARVHVDNVNDEKPTFHVPIKTVTFSENDPVGTSQPLDVAIDLDANVNERETYSWVEKDAARWFALDHTKSSLSMHLLSPLDYETRKLFNLTLRACDAEVPPLCGYQIVLVQIIDVNDVSPTFTQDSYSAVISEDLPKGSLVENITAVDPEEGKNGQIVYSLGRSQHQLRKYFSIDNQTGQVFLKAQLEGGESYRLVIEARDCGEIPLYKTTTLSVFVVDKNNHAPEINIQPFASSLINVTVNTTKISGKSHPNRAVVYQIFENTAPPVELAFISAKDKDKEDNGAVKCLLQESTASLHKTEKLEKYFIMKDVVDSKTSSIYKLTLIQSLDREKMERLTVPILCHDHGKEISQTTIRSIIIQIQDVNEHSAEFLKELYEGFVEEERPPTEEAILTLSWKDEDVVKNVTFHLPEEVQTHFRVDQTGNLIALRTFDREKKSFFEFPVTLQDHGYGRTFTSSCRVRVNILDINDNAPEFTEKGPFLANENEHSKVETCIGQVTARDKDDLENAQIVFELSDPQQQQIPNSSMNLSNLPIRLAKDGSIFLTRSIDREVNDSFDFRVIAKDMGKRIQLSSVALVRVLVLDANDNAPQWIIPAYSGMTINISMSSYSPPHSIITFVRAVDKDVGMNSNVTYELLNYEDHFYLDPFTGAVQLLRQPQSDNYRLKLLAVDRGYPPRSNETELVVFFISDPVFMAGVTARRNLTSKLLYILIVFAGSLIACLCLVMCIIMARRSTHRTSHPPQVYNTKSSSQNHPVKQIYSPIVSDCRKGLSGLNTVERKASQDGLLGESPQFTSASCYLHSPSCHSPRSSNKPLTISYSSPKLPQRPHEGQVYWTPSAGNTLYNGIDSSTYFHQQEMQSQHFECPQTDSGIPTRELKMLPLNTSGPKTLHELDEGSADSGHGASEEDMQSGRGKCSLHFALERNGAMFPSRKSPYCCPVVLEEYSSQTLAPSSSADQNYLPPYSQGADTYFLDPSCSIPYGSVDVARCSMAADTIQSGHSGHSEGSLINSPQLSSFTSSACQCLQHSCDHNGLSRIMRSHLYPLMDNQDASVTTFLTCPHNCIQRPSVLHGPCSESFQMNCLPSTSVNSSYDEPLASHHLLGTSKSRAYLLMQSSMEEVISHPSNLGDVQLA